MALIIQRLRAVMTGLSLKSSSHDRGGKVASSALAFAVLVLSTLKDGPALPGQNVEKRVQNAHADENVENGEEFS